MILKKLYFPTKSIGRIIERAKIMEVSYMKCAKIVFVDTHFYSYVADRWNVEGIVNTKHIIDKTQEFLVARLPFATTYFPHQLCFL